MDELIDGGGGCEDSMRKPNHHIQVCRICGREATRRLGVVVSTLDGKIEEVPLCENCFYSYDVKKVKQEYVFKRKRMVSRKAGIFLAIESVRMAKVVERLATGSLGRLLASKAMTILGMVGMVLAIGLLITNLIRYAINPQLLESVQTFFAEHPLHGALMVPGIDPMIPLIQGWIALIVTLSIHEMSHAVVAARLGVGEPRAVGALFLGPIPVAGYVDVNPSFIKSKKGLYVVAAGVGSNILTAFFCWLPLSIYASLRGLPIGLYVFFPPELLSALGVASPFNGLAASTVCWMGFLSFWLAILNATPIPGLDGYYMLAGTLSRAVSPEKAFKLTKFTGFFTTGLIVFMVLVQRMPPIRC